MKRIILLVLLLALVGAGAFADHNPGYLTVQANYVPSATVTDATLAFHDFYPGEADFDAYTQVNVNVPAGQLYTVAMDQGLHSVGAQRRLASTDLNWFVNYDLYDVASGHSWGDGATYGWTVPGTGTGSDWGFQVKGTLHSSSALQGSQAGWYTDTVTVTVLF
jgi:spore coat protein U-like protein